MKKLIDVDRNDYYEENENIIYFIEIFENEKEKDYYIYHLISVK